MKDFFNRKTVGADLVAGLTLGIESVPDGMASGLLAAVNPIHGVYAYMVGTFTGAFVTSSVFMAVQAPSAMALIVAGVPQVHADENGLEALVALTVLTGILVAIFGLLKFGRFLRFVSNAVNVGFVTGVGVLTILGQLDNLTAYTSEGANRLAKTMDLIRHMDQIDIHSLFVGIVTILLILGLEKTRLKSFGLVVAIFLASLLPALFNWDSISLVADLADIPSALPRPVLPPLSVFPALILPAISLALVALVQGSGVSQAYANPDGQYPDPDQGFCRAGRRQYFLRRLSGHPGQRFVFGDRPFGRQRRQNSLCQYHRRDHHGGCPAGVWQCYQLPGAACAGWIVDSNWIPHYQTG